MQYNVVNTLNTFLIAAGLKVEEFVRYRGKELDSNKDVRSFLGSKEINSRVSMPYTPGCTERESARTVIHAKY